MAIITFQYYKSSTLQNSIIENQSIKLFKEKVSKVKLLTLQAREALKQYILSAKQSDLDIYYSKVQSIENSINQIKFQNELDIHILFQKWTEYAHEKIISIAKLSKSEYSINDIITEINTQKGKNYFDIFRIKIDSFIETEEYLLKGRKENFEASIAANRAILIDEVKLNARWVEHTHKVIINAKDLLIYALNIETGARGYLITGNKKFLEPYEGSVKIFFEHLRELKKTVSDNQEQVSALRVISEHMEQWLNNILKPLIDKRTKIGDLEAEQNILNNLMDKKEKKLFSDLNNELNKALKDIKGRDIW